MSAVGGAGRAEVVGLGLVGSSVALALRAAGWSVSGRDVDEERARRAVELGVVERVEADPEATIVFVATPVSEIAGVARSVLAARPGDSRLVVTDVGGVKSRVVAAVEDPRFVGGHPMAGSEQEGPDGADPDLFVGATWVLTPTKATDPEAFRRVRSVVGTLGADVVELEPERHDALVAIVSHLPHLAAANLMSLAADASTEHAVLLRLAAGGFRDMTRIAAGDPRIWPDIFRDNADAVLEALDDLRARLDEARRILVEKDRDALVALLERARSARRNLPPRAPRPESVVECRLPVPDRPGVLAEVTTVLGALGANIRDLEIAHSAEGERGVLVLVVDADDAEVVRAALVGRGYRPSFRALA
ncbi:MAG: prephenate dehydrogenase [Actinomycetota bacterium]|nr:prephenate dehydrogenase [Actinomycetota bacterium]